MIEGDQHVPGADVADVQRMFADLAAAYPDLRLYRALCDGAAADDEVAALLTAARPGQARPVLLLAALHELVLRRPELALARWYPSVTGDPVPDGDPWPEARRTALDHAEELRATIASRSTQTNEVGRAAFLAPMLAQAAADVPGSPVALVELGASAGLLLGLDRYRIELVPADDEAPPGWAGGAPGRGGSGSGGVVPPVVLGDPASPVVCSGVLRSGRVPPTPLPVVVERVGLDRAPVALDDPDERRWLEACLWPDVPERLERFRAAIALLRTDPPSLAAGDMVDDLEAVAHAARAVVTAAARAEGSVGAGLAASAGAPGPVHLVVFSSWALTYVAREDRPRLAEALAAVAADGRPVSWLTAEPAGCAPGIPPPPDGPDDGSPIPTEETTVLGARRWRSGAELPPARWGTSHPHGATLTWTPTP